MPHQLGVNTAVSLVMAFISAFELNADFIM